MGNNAIYKKSSGRNTYLENKMIKDIEDKRSKNPSSYNYGTATTKEELERIHTNYVEAENADIISETKDKVSDNSSSTMSDISDPHNESAPKIRDYVKDEGFSRDGNDDDIKINNNFEQPTNWDDAYELPSDDDIDDKNQKTKSNDKPTNNSTDKSSSKKKESINPDFDDMSPSAQKKETKRFAKAIVETGCTLIEKGFIWYATKDFTDAKLIEYEINGEMDLSLFVDLGSGQRETIRNFFNQLELKTVEQMKFDAEYKEDLTNALYKVMLEKGIAPTPMQNLMIVIGQGIIQKGAVVLENKMVANSVLNQLREMKINSGDYNTRHATDTNEEPLTSEGVEDLFKEEPIVENAPTTDEGEE